MAPEAARALARLAGVETSTTGLGAIDDLAAVVFVVELAFDGRADALQGILVKSALIPRKEGRMSSLGSERERVDSVDSISLLARPLEQKESFDFFSPFSSLESPPPSALLPRPIPPLLFFHSMLALSS